MSGTEPMAPWAFRAALSGLPEDEVRDILESDRCPAPERTQDHTVCEQDGPGLVVRDAEREGAWLRSDEFFALTSMR
ncbi:hypothetical protein [Halorarius halobius]|uniref:hypothetical protein n=1 Tax=Halorarius halobius TaxID=2962671 RepID=UPI0020CE35D9|nr:hypothetical protein [Halorarius halobius]